MHSFNHYISVQGHSTSNEQIFRNPHALCLRILFNFFRRLPNYPNEQIQNLSFLLQILFQLNVFSWHMVGSVSEQNNIGLNIIQTPIPNSFIVCTDTDLALTVTVPLELSQSVSVSAVSVSTLREINQYSLHLTTDPLATIWHHSKLFKHPLQNCTDHKKTRLT